MTVKECCLTTRHGGAWRRGDIAPNQFLTLVLDGVSGKRHAPAAFYPWGNDPRFPIGQKAWWASEPPERRPLPWIEPFLLVFLSVLFSWSL
jgi:hypothetical protein